jgi:hypothetical protein
MISLRIFFTASAIAVTAAAAAGSAGADNMSDHKATIETLMNAMRAKDAATIRTLFDANGQQQYGNASPKTGKAFLAWIESDVIAAEAVVDDTVMSQAEGGIVVTGTIRNNNGYKNKANFLFKVDAGKINSWHIRY